ncbi:hypothetical protein DL769_006769 [Monosporascus sp. CRB-8-3]|nr:hypothetical protein DL769_006769 [Monosporascus sp. CRB-8-3]
MDNSFAAILLPDSHLKIFASTRRWGGTGKFDDPIRIKINRAELVQPAHDNKPKRLLLKEIEESLPEGWSAHETLEGRLIFWDRWDGQTFWTHPDSSLPRDTYDPVIEECDGAQVQYEALSYTWGSSTSRRNVVVEERLEEVGAAFTFEKFKPDCGSLLTSDLSIMPNLSEALQYLRYENRPRVMWIDAICINQDDVQERNVQVKRMSQIFSLARNVVACVEKTRSYGLYFAEWLNAFRPRKKGSLSL